MSTSKNGFQRLLIFALSLIMMLGVFTACSNPASQKETSGQSAKIEISSASGNAEEKEEVVSLRWITGGVPQTNPDQALEAFNNLLEERYGINLVFDIYEFGTFDEKMNMIISSGEYYDLCFTTQNWVNKYESNVRRGAFMPLDDLIEKHAPGLRKVLPEFLFDQARTQGSIYAIPNYQICYDATGFMMRKDLVDKYKFDWQNVKTYQDMFPFWDAVLENDPDLYPLISPEKDFMALLSGEEFITVAGDAMYKKGDDSYTVGWFPEEFKEYRIAYGDLYRRGYIREDIITAQDTSADVAAGKYASFLGVIKPGGEAERSAQTGGLEYVQIAVSEPFINPVAARSTMTAISSGSKEPEAAIRMIEIINSDKELYNMLNFGLEGVNYTLEDGFVQEIPESGYFYNTAWAIGNQFHSLLLVGQQEGIWEETMAINNSAEVSPISGFAFDDTNVATEVAQLSAIGAEFDMMGLYDDFDARYENYITKKNQAGIERYCEEVQVQLNEWLKENGKK